MTDVRIKPLSSIVANQIAAGEVIENPASVVKELLENALDAGATAISIDIGFGGLNQIKISDNGVGIIAEDLPLAIAPHATSKLSQLADLSTLTSMGFRGEALASIASVSRFTLSSKPAVQDHAMMLTLDGTDLQLSPCARNQGTTVDVRDLFYNAPVRRRFQKSERSEYLSIEHVVKRFALSVPEMSITLKHNDKLMLELPPALHEHALRIRIQRLLGKSFVDGAVQLNVARAGMHLTGWISGPDYQRSQNDKQWIYLNQRMIKDKLIVHAFKHAYENRLYPGRHPACLLYLSIPTSEVDVNVHPTKHEVRFQHPRLVHDFVGSQILAALQPLPVQEKMLLTPFDESSPMLMRESPFACPQNEGVSEPSQVLREVYQPPVLRPVSRQAVSHRATWMMANQEFGILSWHAHAYLFHIQKAQQARCLHVMQQLPLASRPLLVPVSIEHGRTDTETLESSLADWLPFGVQMELKGKRLWIRTVPLCMPQLNVQSLLYQVAETIPQGELITRVLVNCHLATGELMSVDDKAVLDDFIVQQLEQQAPIHDWCTCLDVARCHEVLSVFAK
jgi:DNA mismatch repair protein MutL